MTQPHRALDYPQLPDALWLIWSGNEYKWPDARRSTWFLTDHKRHILHGFALFSPYAESAATFATEQEAQDWLKAEQASRPHPYSVTISTVAAMKQARGYTA